MASVTMILHLDELERDIAVELDGVVREEVLERGMAVKREVQSLIRSRAAENTPGGLADSVYGELLDNDGESWICRVASDLDHSIWFEDGTGKFGPRKSFIFPHGSGAMIFKPRGKTSRVFAFKVKGQPGKHPFRDGLEAVRRG